MGIVTGLGVFHQLQTGKRYSNAEQITFAHFREKHSAFEIFTIQIRGEQSSLNDKVCFREDQR